MSMHNRDIHVSSMRGDPLSLFGSSIVPFLLFRLFCCCGLFFTPLFRSCLSFLSFLLCFFLLLRSERRMCWWGKQAIDELYCSLIRQLRSFSGWRQRYQSWWIGGRVDDCVANQAEHGF
jgi:hypothetical protein